MAHTVIIEKLVSGGQGLAHLDGKAIFVWNALPGEEVGIEYIKNKKDFAEAVATKILKSSPDRIEPVDNHFLSTSPWQMLNADKEDEYKKQIAIETYKRLGGDIFSNTNPDIISDPKNFFHYRNKMEFSFVDLNCLPLSKGEMEEGVADSSKISLAFFERGKKVHIPAIGSQLAEDIINKTAQYILTWVNTHKIPMRSLKSLIVRSNGQGKAIAALFIKDQLPFGDYPELDDNLVGFQLYYSTHKSPASVPTKLLYLVGQNYLVTQLSINSAFDIHHSAFLKFGLLSFFQINIPIFEQTLQDISKFINPNIPLVDYYSGVGSIGLTISQGKQPCMLVDNNEEAIQYAQENIALNNFTNCEAHCKPAEKMLEYITPDKTIIVDPPRAGLHPDVAKRLNEVLPPTIIYLSCDLATQARDVEMLSQNYDIVFHRLYNFFPRTPHIEGLVVLSRTT
ncbi:MAG: RsmD family RNA methyltransferase [Candidatus Magasanikbacteria bacterium]